MSDPENEIGRQRATMTRSIGRPDRLLADQGGRDRLAAPQARLGHTQNEPAANPRMAAAQSVLPRSLDRGVQPVPADSHSRAAATEQRAAGPGVRWLAPGQDSGIRLRQPDPPPAEPYQRSISNAELNALNELIMDFGDFDSSLRPDLRAVTDHNLIEYGLLATEREITTLIGRIEVARAPTLLTCAALVDRMHRYIGMVGQSAALSTHIQRNQPLREMYAALRSSLQAVSMFPGLDSALAAHRNAVAAEEIRARREREAAEWVGEVTPYPANPDSRIWVGETRGPLTVLKINQAQGFIEVFNRVTGEIGRFFYTDWYNHRGIVAIYHAPWLDAARESVVLQFLYGMVEGFSRGVQGVLETILKIDEVVEAIGRMLADIPAIGAAIWQEILNWIKEFSNASDARQARMIGRIVGGLLFELFLTKGLGRIAFIRRAEEILASLRARSIAALAAQAERAVARLGETRAGHAAIELYRRLGETRAGQAAIELYRDERGAVNFSALFGGSASIRGTAREAGIYLYRQLSEAGYTVRGRLRAIVPDIHRYPTVEVRPSGDILGSYSDVMRYLNDARLTGARRVGRTTLEAHHLLEDRLMTSFGISQRQGLCIALEASDHAIFSGELPRYLPRGRLFFDIDEIFHAHSLMYQKAGRPEWIRDIRAFLRQHRDEIRRIYQQGRIPGRRGSDFPQRLERVQDFLDSL